VQEAMVQASHSPHAASKFDESRKRQYPMSDIVTADLLMWVEAPKLVTVFRLTFMYTRTCNT
jgi:hypothetical protein